jgi:hypothetical protein
MAADDRSFSFTVSASGSLLPDIAALLTACKRQQVSTAATVDAVRSYLSRQLSAKRCPDTAGMSIALGIGNAAPQQAPDAVTFFNSVILADVYPADTVIAPLGGDEVRASAVEDPVEPERAPKSAELTEISDRYHGLVFNSLGTSWSSQEKADTVWQSKLREYLVLLSAWKPGQSMNPQDYFYRKCYLLGSLVNVVPDGGDRELVLRHYLDFLQQYGYQQGSRIEWFLPLNTLLFRVQTDQSLAALAEDMRNSGDSVVALYAQLSRIAPPSPAKMMALM